MYIILKKGNFFGSAKKLEEALALLPTDEDTARKEFFDESNYRMFGINGEVQIYLYSYDIDDEGNFIDVPKEERKWCIRETCHR